MNLRQQLNVRLSQNLVMTQSLQQAIKLLQLNRVELEQFIQQELVENPVLEEESVETEPSAQERETAAREETTKSVDEGAENVLAEVDVDYFYEDYIEYQHRRAVREYIELPAFDATLATPTNLGDHLNWQLHLSTAEDSDIRIGEAIIGNLNTDGYLRATTEEIAKLADAEETDVQDVLAMMQLFDPVGVAARDLRECLLVQLRQLSSDCQLPIRIVSDYLGYLEKRAYSELAKKLDCTMEDIQQALEVIRNLDPKPGSKFNVQGDITVEPDVFIVRDGNDYQIVLNDGDLPKLRISRRYQQLLKRGSDAPEETRSYVRERMNSAKWLMKSFVQRQRTIYKVVESIVKKQRDFLDRGIDHLRPMILSDVAYDIGMHESTVSRVVSNKYVHTPRGLFELKYFFTTGIRSASGEEVSALTVKSRIKQIVEEEDPRKPLSDSKIMAILNREGLRIARRTVAKYREEMRIPPSKHRKTPF